MCETRLWLSQKRLDNNLRLIRSRLPADTKILINLKANAYGHGAVLLGKYLENKADYFSVACQKEGMELREAGIGTPVIVYNPPVEWNRAFFEARLEPVLYGLEQAKALADFLRKEGLNGIRVHVKLDTGMHRSGLIPGDTDEMIALLRQDENMHLTSVFSHLAAADDPKEADFTRAQIALFDRLSRKFFTVNDRLIRHIANSSAIYAYPEAVFDMVRPGLSVYGISPVAGEWETLLQPIGQMVSRITQIRTVKKGETVGYNRKFTAPRDTRVALIPTGYGDGYKRALGLGKGYVTVNGMAAPVIGKVNMDMITVDVTDIPASIGDLAVLFGDKPRVDELARLAGTIPYDITTSVSRRVARIWHNF